MNDSIELFRRISDATANSPLRMVTRQLPFISAAHELIEFVIDYVENVRERPVLPSVEPGYLRPLLPDKPPYRREEWSKIMPDIERCIMPGVSISPVVAWPSPENTPALSVRVVGVVWTAAWPKWSCIIQSTFKGRTLASHPNSGSSMVQMR